MSVDNMKQMDKWKKEYEEISVPEEAKSRINQGIKQAKTGIYQTKIVRIFRNTGTVVAASLVLLMVAVNTNETLAKSLEDVPILGQLTRIITLDTYQNQTGSHEAEVEIPKIESEGNHYDLSNAQIEAYAQQFIREYEESLKTANGQGNYALESHYTVIGDNSQYLSIRIDTIVIMASGAQYVKVFHVDKETGNVVTLPELFENSEGAKEAISNNIMEQMKTQMEQDEMVSYFYESDMPESDYKGLTGEESFFFNEAGELVILYNEYEVAPGYMGAVSFTIPKQITDPYR